VDLAPAASGPLSDIGAMDHEVIVVGTGYGGATAAAVLARAGLRVGILERGTWWGAFGGHRPLPETLPQILRALEGLNVTAFGRSIRIPLSRKGLLEAHLHGATLMMNAVAVGGTSLVNSALMQRPAASFFDALPAELTASELEPRYRAVEAALSIAPGPADERNRQLLAALADDQKWKLTPAPQAIRWESSDPSRPACIRCNRCMLGCNVGAKQSLDLTLVPRALDAGAVLRDLCEVQTVEPIERGYAVWFRDARTRRVEVWRAPRVVLAAGTLNTLKILFRSSAPGGLGKLGSLGQNASLGADTLSFYRAPRDVVASAIDGHCMDSVLEVPDAVGDRELSFALATLPLLPGSVLLRRAQGRRTLSLVGFGRDAMDGRVVWNGRGIQVRHQAQAVVGRILAAMDRTAEAFGWDKPERRHDPAQPGRPWMSVHPMGGCRMASDASRGVVDFAGEVFGHPGLHIADASVFASAPAAGPALSVAALAWWIAERIAEQAGRAGA
jgi:cholesterol oxidase